MRSLFLLICVAFLTVNVVSGQSYTSANYHISAPLGSSKDFVDLTSFRGFSLDYNSMVSENLSVGVHTSFTTFYQVVEQGRVELQNGLITGKQYNYLNTMPLLLSFRYFVEKEKFIPYGGIGIGTMWAKHRTDMGTYSAYTDTWHFAVSPEVGVILPVDFSLGINLGVRYQNGFKTGDLNTTSYMLFVVGFTFID